jgi:hypothetical protein
MFMLDPRIEFKKGSEPGASDEYADAKTRRQGDDA